MNDRRLTILALLCVLVLCVPSLVFIASEVVFPGHDSWLHAQWSTAFLQQFWEGDLYPKWLVSIDQDAGSPVMYYYQPMAYFLVAPLYLTFPGEELFYIRMNASNMLALFAAFFSMFFFVQSWLGGNRKHAPFYAALLYVSQPYYLLVDMYVRGANSELWSFACVPIMFLGAVTLRNDNSRGFALIVLGVFLLSTTHIVSAVYWLPIFTLFLITSGLSRTQLFISASAITLGIGSGAAYLATALGYLHLLDPDTMYHLDKVEDSFVFTVGAVKHFFADPISFKSLLLLSALFLVLSSVVFLIFYRRFSRPTCFWVAMLIGAMFFISALSKPFWAHLPVLYKVQFSWRLLGVMCFASVCLYAVALRSSGNKSVTIMLLTLPVGLSLVIPMVATVHGLNYAKSGKALDNLRLIRQDRIGAHRQGEVARSHSLEYELVPLSELAKTEHFAIAEADVAAADISVLENSGRNLSLTVNTPKATTVRLRRQAFYGTEVRVNENILEDTFYRKTIAIELPKGLHSIKVKLKRMPVEIMGYLVSLLSILLSIFIYLKLKHHSRKA